MNRFMSGALLLTIALGASGAAHAAFPSCDATVSNPPLMPLPDGSYPADPAIPFIGSHTKWTVDGLEIKLAIDNAAATNFYIHGVNYEPTQIGGSADFSPFNDFFYTNSVSTWTPLWSRDIPALRAMGVNSLRNYGMWKWEPGFAQKADAPDGVATFWNLLNFSALKSSENDNQFCFPGSNGSIYAFQHPTHADFLDLLWNNGVNPIYTWIGVSLPLPLVDPNVPEGSKTAFRQFYRYTAKWLAKKYGDHPAVIGFVVGNELDTPGTTPTSEFWQTLNDIGAIIKASAPNKLTAFTFHDTDDYNRTIMTGPFANLRGPNVYGLDVYGFNPYTNPLPEGNLFSRFRDNVVENCKQTNGSPCVRPMMFGEFGTPADAHAVSSDPKKTYPVQWVAENFIWKSSPPPAECLAPTQLGPPPGSGGDGPLKEFQSGKTIAVELPKGAYTMPANLAPFFPSSGVGDALPAGSQADWVKSFLAVSKAHKASNSAPPSDLDFNSGGYAFEWRDEWWKANPVPYFHSITGTDNCTSCTATGPQPDGCDTGAANVAFSGGWGDEEWFGVVGATANGRKNSDPIVAPSTGKLNGGPDILEPRAAVVALCQAFGNCP
jgi:hypothetical protein